MTNRLARPSCTWKRARKGEVSSRMRPVVDAERQSGLGIADSRRYRRKSNIVQRAEPHIVKLRDFNIRLEIYAEP